MVVSVWVVVVVAALLGFATRGSAIPTLTISDGSTVDSFSDASGIVQSGEINIGVWTVVVSGETTPALGNNSTPQMDLVVQASSSVAGTLYLALSEVGFTGSGGVVEQINGQAFGGASATVGAAAYGNSGNIGGTLNASGSQNNFGSLLANVPVQSLPVLASATGMFPGTVPYALTEYVVITSAGATSTSIDASLAGVGGVPDGGATVTLLGTALAGLGLLGRFVKRR
jgi:hypothetical protein